MTFPCRSHGTILRPWRALLIVRKPMNKGLLQARRRLKPVTLNQRVRRCALFKAEWASRRSRPLDPMRQVVSGCKTNAECLMAADARDPRQLSDSERFPRRRKRKLDSSCSDSRVWGQIAN
jgi:hypothetical protein